MKFIKKPVIAEATQWFEIGDHSAVESITSHPFIEIKYCSRCEHSIEKHGILYNENGNHVICPGDYILQIEGLEPFRCSLKEFKICWEAI